ncbi:MAG: transporter [Cyclobacteriaceae bacterium]|nr:MAG: transporter [Cyclobacteriaceae bacterium]
MLKLSNRWFYWFGFLTLIPQFVLGQAEPNLFTLEDCLTYGFENQAQVQNANLERQFAIAQIGETRADGLPQVNGYAEYSNFFNIQKSFLPAIIFDPNAPSDEFVAVPFSQQYNGLATLTGSQMIFDGSYFVGLQAARTFKSLSDKDYIKSKTDVAESITKAYYTVLVTQVGLDLINHNYGRLDTLLTETTLLHENGFAEKIDVSRVQVEFNNTESQRSRAERSLNQAYNLLKFQMGMPLSQTITLAETIEDITLEVLDYNFQDFSYQDRIEFGQLEVGRSLAELDLKNNKAKYLPSIDAFATLGTNTATNTRSEVTNFDDKWLNYGLFGFRLNVPIFDGLRKSYLVQQNRIQLAQIDNDMRYLKQSIDLEQEQAKIDFENSLENLRAQKKNMALALEVYEVTRIKYQEGIGSNIEVIDAETTYEDAQSNFFNALYDVLIAKVDMEKALGILYKPNSEE